MGKQTRTSFVVEQFLKHGWVNFLKEVKLLEEVVPVMPFSVYLYSIALISTIYFCILFFFLCFFFLFACFFIFIFFGFVLILKVYLMFYTLFSFQVLCIDGSKILVHLKRN